MPAPTPVNVPIVDFSSCSLDKPLNKDDEEVKETVEEVVKALEDYGVLYLINHGMDTGEIDNLRRVSRQFFQLPAEVKRRSIRTAELPACGWIADQSEYLGETDLCDLKECYNITYANIDDYSWPDDDLVPGFRAINKKVIENFNQLSLRFFTLLGENLSPNDPAVFHRAFENFTSNKTDNMTCLRSLYYPPMSSYEKDYPSDQPRLGEHADYGLFSFVIQDQSGGLEFKGRDDVWFEVKPLEGAVMMLSAHMLEVWTSERIKAAPHRLRRVPGQKDARESTAYFAMPNGSYPVTPIDGSTSSAITMNEFSDERQMHIMKKEDD